MVNLYSSVEFTRKVGCIKDILYANGFYETVAIARTKVLSGASGSFHRNVTITYTDVIVSGIAEVGPEFRTFDELVETIDGDVRFTVREVDASKVSAANEIWLDVPLVNGVIQYVGDQFESGTMYKVHSDKQSLFQKDRIYILRLGGQQR